MTHYDIFNGDADGIIALIQLRLSKPIESTLITGVKRDIALLERVVPTCGDSITVLDISMEKNRAGLVKALEAGANVFYADHHRSGEQPVSENLSAHIDLDPNTCTSLIVDGYLQSEYHSWAIAAAYGDNLIAKADELSLQAGYSKEQSGFLKELGTLINYNGYGSTTDDLHFHPAELYKQLLKYSSPFEVLEDLSSPYYALKSAYESDLSLAQAVLPRYESEYLAVFELPDSKASRRISGVFGNLLANNYPSRANAVLTTNTDGTFTVSLRAPLINKVGAGDICAEFSTGGGRAAAAGINRLPEQHIAKFIEQVEAYYAS